MKISKNNNFYHTILKTTFGSLIGSFLIASVLFLSLSLTYTISEYVRLSFFSLLGVVVYSLSLIVFLSTNKKDVVLTETNFKHHKKLLIRYVMFTSVFYLLLTFFLLMLMGTFNGFGLYFVNEPAKLALVSNSYQTKILGIILFLITLGLTALGLLTHVLIFKFFNKANNTFIIRRKIIDKVRTDAQKDLE